MKLALCNEVLKHLPFADACRAAASFGYTGLEIAPFTLAPQITDVSAAQRRDLRAAAEDAGLAIIGLHWLFAGTDAGIGKTYHLNAPDAATRARTADYLAALADAAADLAPDTPTHPPVLVLGSPPARALAPGVSHDQALDHAADTLRRGADTLADRGVELCLEPLGPEETDFLNTAAQARDLIRRVDHPAVRLLLDVKAMCTEATPIPTLIADHADVLSHFHANDSNRRGPGMGDTDFSPVLTALRDAGYSRWISVEPFDLTPTPEWVTEHSAKNLVAAGASPTP